MKEDYCRHHKKLNRFQGTLLPGVFSNRSTEGIASPTATGAILLQNYFSYLIYTLKNKNGQGEGGIILKIILNKTFIISCFESLF